jgi:hypothetical protein
MQVRLAALTTAWLMRPAEAEPVATPTVTVAGYIETFYQLHFQNPDNRLTNLRGFDNRSRTFTLSNVALDVLGTSGRVSTRIVLQVGHTPSTYYLAEPRSPGAIGANASDSELWKYVQAATFAVRAPRETTIEAGLFPSPIGPEVLPVKDNWNWSRSNLFFGLPFYHAGFTVSRPLASAWSGKLHVYNGWNSVVDNNGYPSVAVSAAYAGDGTTAQLLYFGGVERSRGAAEGNGWRHLLDAYAQHRLTDTVVVAAHADAGIEPNDVGTSWWIAGAIATRLELHDTGLRRAARRLLLRTYGWSRCDLLARRVDRVGDRNARRSADRQRVRAVRIPTRPCF